MTIRTRLMAAAAVLLAAGAAQAQTPPTTSQTPAGQAMPGRPATGAAGRDSMTQTTPTAPAGALAAPSTGAQPPAADAPATEATLPSTEGAAAAPPSGGAFTTLTPAPGADLVTVLTQSGQFSTFLKAADATNLTSVLKTAGLTVFAPTDAAFAALPAGKLDELMKPDNLPQLQKLLAYHLVNTKIPAIKGHARTEIATAAGSKVTLDGTGDQVKVNDATTLQPAVSVANGETLYPIDKVLSPDYVAPPAPAGAEDAAPAAEDTKAAPAKSTRKTTRRKR